MRRRDEGFGLIDLMIGLAITAVLASQLFLVLRSQKHVYINNERMVDIQSDTRLVVDLLTSDIRTAGYMVPRRAGIGSRDGGTTASDALCTSDSTVINNATLSNRASHFSRARVVTIAAGSVTVVTGDLDVDGDGSDPSTGDFAVGAGILISDGAKSHCARITAINTGSNVISFTPNLVVTGWVAGTARAAPAIVYEVGSSCGAGLTRNCQLLSSEVEDMQIEFGVDDVVQDGVIDTGTAEFPVHDLDGHDPARVRTVRLTVFTRTQQTDEEFDSPGLAASANRTAGSTDHFRRRRFTTVVSPRNLM